MAFKAAEDDASETRRGTNRVSTNGVTANVIIFDRGTFWVLSLTYFYLPKSARAYFSVKTYFFFSGPISVEPICPQPSFRDGAAGKDAGAGRGAGVCELSLFFLCLRGLGHGCRLLSAASAAPARAQLPPRGRWILNRRVQVFDLCVSGCRSATVRARAEGRKSLFSPRPRGVTEALWCFGLATGVGTGCTFQGEPLV